MPAIDLNLTGPAWKALADRGIKLPGLASTKRLAPGSRIEGPTAVLSTVAPGAFIDVGAFCNLSGGTINNVRVGRYCSVAAGVVIGPHEHPTDWLTTSRIGYYPQVNDWDDLMAGADAPNVHKRKRPFAGSCPNTTLEPDVWIGNGAFIKAGVTIGAGAIIGARSTVLKDVPPYAVIVGTPGRVLRLRFPEATIARLLAVQWWRYSIYDLFDAPFDDVEAALDVIEEKIGSGAVRPFQGVTLEGPDFTAALGAPAEPLRAAG